MTGFSYNGVHCSTFGLVYVPSYDDLWVSNPEFDVYDKDVEWRHGGYWYGAKARKRTFTIKCLFEEIDIATREKIKQWVRRDSAGQLVFDDKPFVYWDVRPGKIPVGNWYMDNNDTHSGTVTLTFNCYDPFGHLTRKYNTPSNTGVHDDGASDYCNLIMYDEMPADPVPTDTSFNVYNPGTEECGLTIEISGTTSNPFRFFNATNNTECVFESLPADGLHVKINGENGYVMTKMAGSDFGENGYAYHDRGVVRLSPNTPDNVNHILIQEKNESGSWGQPSTLQLTSIAIDYVPKIL